MPSPSATPGGGATAGARRLATPAATTRRAGGEDDGPAHADKPGKPSRSARRGAATFAGVSRVGRDDETGVVAGERADDARVPELVERPRDGRRGADLGVHDDDVLRGRCAAPELPQHGGERVARVGPPPSLRERRSAASRARRGPSRAQSRGCRVRRSPGSRGSLPWRARRAARTASRPACAGRRSRSAAAAPPCRDPRPPVHGKSIDMRVTDRA